MQPVSCVRDQDVALVPARHRYERISLDWSQIMVQKFMTFLEFAEFTEFSFNFWKTPMMFKLAPSTLFSWK